jgi:hypothetical protein
VLKCVMDYGIDTVILPMLGRECWATARGMHRAMIDSF